MLAQKCLVCHDSRETKGGLDLSAKETALKGGESGAVLVPGKLGESYLWERISSDEMPPKHPLSDDEKSLFKTWIEQGAKWGTDPIDPFAFTTDARAGYDWWSLQKLTRPAVPVELATDSANPIDAFIRRRLIQKKLMLSPPADRRTLIRRLSFDLIGLPPTPAEVESFIADESPDAYERLVDRLLQSPHYGERWARHWLDLARFGESQGFERDKIRENAWPYRDWVIESLNRDLPYDEFVRQQLAGDALHPDDAAAITATGFLVAAPYDEVGQSQQSAAMRAVVRQDELEDIVGTVGQTFLGLTVNCARCHDHKFDPITQLEYYQLAAALAGVRHGERKVHHPENLKRAKELQKRLDSLRTKIAERFETTRQEILSKLNLTPPPPAPQPIARWSFDSDFRDELGELHLTPVGGAKLVEGRLVLDGKQSYAKSIALEVPLAEKTLEAWVQVGDL
ncbi:MAG TPA: DUF1549 domain-containing protein, partial [Planctomycetaceae bacterium]|nr:DUF1549 domain-containing protein [Planctomycetaceae bacterium]